MPPATNLSNLIIGDFAVPSHSTCVALGEPKRIYASSQSQAMDWSLALASQGIEPIIDQSTDKGDWGLIVSESEYQAALETIRAYNRENRWPWRRELVRTGILFDWGSAAWVLMVLVFYVLEQTAAIRASGIMDSSLVAKGEWWRLFTAVWLHADTGHLAGNATFGFVLLGLALGRYGTGAGLLASYLGGVAGNIAGWALAGETIHRSLGASGMVMAALGLIAAQSWDVWRSMSGGVKFAIGAAAAGLMLFLLMGVAPRTDVVAHAGGFVGGVLLGTALAQVPRLPERTLWQLVAGALFALLTIASWAALVLHASSRLR